MPRFLLEAFDSELQCPVLQARVEVPDLAALRALIRHDKDQDARLDEWCELDETTLTLIREAYGVAFDITPLDQVRIFLRQPHLIDQAPYLVHTNYELLLLLDGRKKLARMGNEFPPFRFEGEDRFDHWVERNVLHREEIIETFGKPIKQWLGTRTVYYTLKGEEWRIPAMKLILNASRKSGGWNEQFERLEGMLFGYEDWQNDWWIEQGRRRAAAEADRINTLRSVSHQATHTS